MSGRRVGMIGVVAVLALVGTACSDRGEDSSSGVDSAETTAAAAGSEDSFGTLASPCGPGDEAADKAGQGGGEGDTQGISDDAIRVGTIADPGFSGAPGLNQEIF